MMRRLRLWTAPACLVLLLLAACQQTPITGRRQFIMLSRGQEMSLGEQAWQQVLSDSRLSHDAAAVAIVERVGRRVAATAHQPDFEWEFKLIDSRQVNAFCLPGGKVAIYAGILPVCKNEAGLAAVIGHEITHATHRHGAERISQGMAVQLLAIGVSKAMESSDPQLREGIMGAFGAGASVGVLLPYSRLHENEADEVGMRYMARAGYDPAEAVALWERMAALGGARPPEILSTHPVPEKRIRRLRGLLRLARQEYDAAPEKYGSGEMLPVAEKAATR